MGHFGTRAIRTRLVRVRVPGAAAQLLRAGRAAARAPRGGRQSVLRAGARRAGSTRWWCSRRWRRSSRRRRSSRARSRSRGRRVQLGYLPRVTIVHTSGKTEGQIYIPEVNWLLMVACVALVLGFRASSDLAAAYGIAVTGTMAITSVLFYSVARERWGWSRAARRQRWWRCSWSSTCRSSPPARPRSRTAAGSRSLVAVGVFTVMTTWKRGRDAAGRAHRRRHAAAGACSSPTSSRPSRTACPGTAVFLTSTRRGTPNVLLHHFKHNKVLHQQVVSCRSRPTPCPRCRTTDKVRIKGFGQGFWGVTAHYGFMQTPDVLRRPARAAGRRASSINEADTSFYLGRETLLSVKGKGMAEWRKVPVSLPVAQRALGDRLLLASRPTASSRSARRSSSSFGGAEWVISHVVLVEPEIAWNTGNVGRSCLAAGAQLHLVEPLGFSLGDKKNRCAGSDYWPRVNPRVWPSWAALERELPSIGEPFFFTARSERRFKRSSTPGRRLLVFGRKAWGCRRSCSAATPSARWPSPCATRSYAPSISPRRSRSGSTKRAASGTISRPAAPVRPRRRRKCHGGTADVAGEPKPLEEQDCRPADVDLTRSPSRRA